MKKKLSKRNLFILTICIVIAFVVIFYLFADKINLSKLDFKDCRDFYSSWGVQYECNAKDAGKKCFYDDECIKNNCVYSQSSFLGRNSKFTGDQNAGGKCDGFLNDNEGVEQCHRKRGEDVKCDWFIS